MMSVMRTTLALEDDALEMAREFARSKRIPLGRAVSELLRRGARQALATSRKGGLEIVSLPEDSRRVTTELVDRLADEIP